MPGDGRRLGLWGATGIGLGSMLGAGVFTVWAPVAGAAGTLFLWAVLAAAAVAACNATATASLARLHPASGGVYAYGRAELHPLLGYAAGLGFVVGKTASLAAMGLAIGAYTWPVRAPWIASAVLLAAWALNARGVTRTAAATLASGLVVVLALLTFSAAGMAQPPAADAGMGGPGTPGQALLAVGSGAALMFFAFAGYARVATLGEEVRDPRRTIPRAVALSLALVCAVYLVVALALGQRLGVDGLAQSEAPVRELVAGTPVPPQAVTVVAVVAIVGAIVALAAGVGRTAMAMAREGDLPRALARRSDGGVPWLAEGIAVLVAVGLAWWGDLTFALAASSAGVLVYYAIANLAALRALWRGRLGQSRAMGLVYAVGLAMCLTFLLALPWAATAAALALPAVAVVARAVVAAVTRAARYGQSSGEL